MKTPNTRPYQLSIIIPVYNRDHSLIHAIESVLSQVGNLKEIEIVLVDDGSISHIKDGIKGIVETIPIHLIRHERNLGVCAAKNTGVRHARAEFVILLDSDDILLPGAIEHIHALLSEHCDLDVLFGQSVAPNGARMGRMPEGPCDYAALLAADEVGEYLPIVRRQVLLEHPFREHLRGFEGLTWLEIARAGHRLYYSNAEVRGYDDRGDDRLCNPDNIRRDASRLAEGYREYLEDFGQDLALSGRRCYLRVCTRLLFYSLLSGNKDAMSRMGAKGRRRFVLAAMRFMFAVVYPFRSSWLAYLWQRRHAP